MKECAICNGCFEDKAKFCPGDGVELVETLPGSRDLEGQWRLVKAVGVGRLGSIYRGRDLKSGLEVFVKTLMPSLFGREGSLAEFLTDVERLRQLDHPAAARTYGGGRLSNGGAYVVLQLLEGQTLKQVLAESRELDIRTAIAGGATVCEALGAAHALGIVHRDVKPDKVLFVDQDGVEQAKLFDFEIAKWTLSGGGGNMTATGSLVIRLPHYSSPEQCRGETIDARSDVYSAAVVIFEMLTGRLPFEAPSPMALIIKHVTDPPEPPTSFRPDIPAEVERVVLRALEKDPAKRYQNGTEFAAALRASVGDGADAPAFVTGSGESAPAEPAPAPGPVDEPQAKRKIPAPPQPLKMRMTIVDADNETNTSRLIDGQVLDVSEYGMRITTGTVATGHLNIIRDHTTAFKNRLEIEVELPAARVKISGFAAWYKPAPDGINWSVGVYIRDMSSADRQAYDAYLKQLAASA